MGAGAPVVMVHCALSSHAPLLPLAQAVDGQVTLLDMPGHGRSDDWDGKRDYQTLVADAIAACCDGPTHVVGHSFGGTAALRLAVERPDLVNRLTLIEPVYFAAAKGTGEHAQHAKVFRPFVGAMLAGDEARAAEVFNDLWGANPWADIPTRIQAKLTQRIHLIVAGAAPIEEDADGIISAERLGALNIPVTLIRGADTQPVIKAIHQALEQRLPRATDHVIAGAAHMVPLTHAEAVAAIICAADPKTG
ncbi:MAG: alpha/beta hydrolase [Pseudomonadota bacterium]